MVVVVVVVSRTTWVSDIQLTTTTTGWLGSRVVSVQKGPGSNRSRDAVGQQP